MRCLNAGIFSLVLALFSGALCPRADVKTLRVDPPQSNGWIRVQSPFQQPNRLLTLHASSNLAGWVPIATLHDGPVSFLDPAAPEFPNRFYKMTDALRTGADDWKNQVSFPEDPFLSAPSGFGQNEVRWIKFAILTSEPNRVYYQDSQKYPFHYDYAVARLNPFKGMTRAAFDRVALHTNDQQVVLGAVLFPAGGVFEYGIQFVGLDPYPREFMARLFDIVKSTVAASNGVRAYYIPAFEQVATAEANQLFFEARGIPVSSADRWSSGDTCYAAGWGMGRLQFVRGTEIDAAYADGRLNPDDILLTDGVPAEVPYVAGIIALRPSTPNSHVTILAKSHALPFVYLANAVERERVQQLAGKQVLLRVSGGAEGCQVKVVQLADDLDPGLKAEILEIKAPPPIAITPKQSFGALSAPVDGLMPSDIRFFGGKAANFGVIRRQIPASSPPGLAFSFDLWDAFLDQTLSSGKTLRTEIAERLARYSYPPPIASLRADLAAIRDTITGSGQFTSEQQQAILSAVSIFPDKTKVRFRSSTNVEDSEHFSGAGLYDSFSGCPADDRDNDSRGPSLCDPSESNERGVFRAIRKVYASFYNENAFLERLRLGVNDEQVGMAILVHLSTPDEIELANGVATLRISGQSMQGELVTQAGATSVTNPDGNAQPEIVNVSKFSFGTFLEIKQRSSLVPLGGNVLEWESDYRTLLGLLESVTEGYRQAVGGKTNLTLDFEYKKISPGILSVKQVREVPSVLSDKPLKTYLLNEPGNYCVFQGEYGDVFGNHRLKSQWFLATRNLPVTPNLSESIYTNATVEFLSGIELTVLTNGISGWPDSKHIVDGSQLRDVWSAPFGTNSRTFTLQSEIPFEVPPSDSPILTQADLQRYLSVTYAQPVPTFNFDGMPARATNESVRLWRCPAVGTESLLQARTFSAGDLTIQTSFYWPKPPGGFTAGYTAPLQAWVETRIEGITSQPLVLRGEYSQTYRPDHHNFGESFIFDPHLEPGLPRALLDELIVANIRFIHVHGGEGKSRITVLGFDDQFRSLP